MISARMRTYVFRSLLALASSTAVLTTTVAPTAAQEAGEGSAAALLDTGFEGVFEMGLTPGMAVVVVRDGETVYRRGFGYADVESGRPVTSKTVFYIASSTKSFTGTAAAILHERGELDLDASLASYLPGLVMHDELSADEITLRDLLTHTHGIANTGPVTFRAAYSGEFTPELMVELIRNHPPAEGGRAFDYGNVGYNIASLAMDAKLGTSWKDVLQREIFGPLGMNATSGYVSRFPDERLAMPYSLEPDRLKRVYYGKGDTNMHAAGGLVTTVDDLARWLEANLEGGRVGGEQLLSAWAVAEAQRPQAEQDDAMMRFERTGYGLGWNTGQYDGEAFTHHFGGFTGFNAHISFMPEHAIGVAVLTNSGAGIFVSDVVSRYAYDRLLDKPGVDARFAEELETMRAQAEQLRARIAEDRDRRATRPQQLPYPLEAYAGNYENAELGRLELELVDGRLEARIGQAWSEVEVYDHEKNYLRVALTGNGTVVPVQFEAGEAVSVRFLGREFVRTR